MTKEKCKTCNGVGFIKTKCSACRSSRYEKCSVCNSPKPELCSKCAGDLK